MNKELEEAIETVLNYIENSIPKEIIEKWKQGLSKEKEEKIKQILNFFNEYELEGLKEIAIKKGKEIEERKIKEEIENLKYKIEKMKSETNK